MADQPSLKRKSMGNIIELYDGVTARLTAARGLLLQEKEIVQQKVELRLIREFAESTKEQLNKVSENAGTALWELTSPQSIELGNPADTIKALSGAIQILEAVCINIKQEYGYGYNSGPNKLVHGLSPKEAKSMRFGIDVPDPTNTIKGTKFVMVLQAHPYNNPHLQGSKDRALAFQEWLYSLCRRTKLSMEGTLNHLMKNTIISPGESSIDGQYIVPGDPDILLADIANYIADTYYISDGGFDMERRQLPPLDEDFFINRFDVRFLDISTKSHDTLGRFYDYTQHPKLAELWDSFGYWTLDGQTMIQLVFSRINANYGNEQFGYERGKAKDYKKVDSVYPRELLVNRVTKIACARISAVTNFDTIEVPMEISSKWLRAFYRPQNFTKAISVTRYALVMPDWLSEPSSPTFCIGEDCVCINVGKTVSGTFFQFYLADGTRRRRWGFFPHLNESAGDHDPDYSIFEVMWAPSFRSYLNVREVGLSRSPSLWNKRIRDLPASVPQQLTKQDTIVSIPAGPSLVYQSSSRDRFLDETPNARPYVPLWISTDMPIEHLMEEVTNGTIWDRLVVTDKPLVELTDEAESMTQDTAPHPEERWTKFYRMLAFHQFKCLMGAIIEVEVDQYDDRLTTEYIRAAFTDLAINGV